MGEHSHLDALVALSEATGNVLDAVGPLGVVEDLVEELAWLLVVGVGVLVCVSTDLAVEFLAVRGIGLVLNWASEGVWLVVNGTAATTVGNHPSITLVVWASEGLGSVWAVNGDVMVVGLEAVSMGIRVVDKSALEHLIVGGLDTWDEVAWGEGDLLSLGMEVVWVPVEGQLTDLLERVVGVRPDLGDVVDIESVFSGVSDRHDLDEPGPGWEVSVLDVVEEVHGGEVLGPHAHLSGLLVGEVLDALVGLEVVLDEVGLTLGVHPFEGVGSVSIHVSVSVWGSTVGHEDSDLVEGFRGVGPEVPCHLWGLDTGLWVSLLGVDEVWEFDWILDEEDWGIVSDHVVISFLGVEFDCESSWISVAVVSATLSSNG